MKPNSTDLTVVLDRSASMASIKKEMEQGYRDFLAKQRAIPGELRITLVQFDDVSIDTVYAGVDAHAAGELVLNPRGNTPLLDAVGQTIVRTGERLKEMAEDQRPEHVMFMILTDGQENASREYTKEKVKALVQQQESVYKWNFLFMGANIDAFAEAATMGVAMASAAPYRATPTGVKNLYSVASAKVAEVRAGGSYTLSADDRALLEEK